MRIAAFSAMTMLAGFCAGHLITDPAIAATTAILLVTGASLCGLAFSGDLE